MQFIEPNRGRKELSMSNECNIPNIPVNVKVQVGNMLGDATDELIYARRGGGTADPFVDIVMLAKVTEAENQCRWEEFTISHQKLKDVCKTEGAWMSSHVALNCPSFDIVLADFDGNGKKDILVTPFFGAEVLLNLRVLILNSTVETIVVKK